MEWWILILIILIIIVVGIVIAISSAYVINKKIAGGVEHQLNYKIAKVRAYKGSGISGKMLKPSEYMVIEPNFLPDSINKIGKSKQKIIEKDGHQIIIFKTKAGIIFENFFFETYSSCARTA